MKISNVRGWYLFLYNLRGKYKKEKENGFRGNNIW